MEHFDNGFTTIFYLIEAANSSKIMIGVPTEDRDVFILLICWVIGTRWSARCKWSGGI